MKTHVEVDTLQNALSDKYRLSVKKETNVFNSVSTETEEES